MQPYCDSCKNRTTQNRRENRRPSLGHVRGKETNLTHLSTQPGGYRNSLVSTIGAQPAETWCPNQGSCHPGCRVWGGRFTWRLWTYDPRYRIWEVGRPGDWTCEHGCRVWGWCGSHCRHVGLDPVRRDPTCALYLSVSGPL